MTGKKYSYFIYRKWTVDRPDLSETRPEVMTTLDSVMFTIIISKLAWKYSTISITMNYSVTVILTSLVG